MPSANPDYRAIVVGGCGFLGHNIVRALLASPSYSSVVVVDLHTTSNRVEGATYVSGDLTSASSISAILADHPADVLFHTASPPAQTNDLPLYMRVNVDGTKNLLACAAEAGVRAFVYTSSASVVHDGVSDLVDGDETLPLVLLPQQREVYSHTKALADAAVLAANDPDGMRTLSLRPSGIFGEGDFTSVARLIELGRSGKSRMQMGAGTNEFDYTYVGNLVDAHLLAADKLLQQLQTAPAAADRVDGEAFLITNDEHMRFWDFVRGIGAAAGFGVKPEDIKVIPRWVGLVMGFIAQWWVWLVSFGTRRSTLNVTGIRYSTLTRTYNVAKAKQRLGYKPRVNMKDGMQRSANWYLEYDASKRKAA